MGANVLKKRPVLSQSRNTTRARSLIKSHSHSLSAKSRVRGEVNGHSLSMRCQRTSNDDDG